MRIRGNGLPQTVPKVVEKPAEGPGAAVAGGTAEPGVLKPGQQLVLPARTGLQHYRDHFDARPQVDYQTRLGGEAAAAKADAEQGAPDLATEPGLEPEMTPEAFDDALSLMDQLPPILLSPAALARAAAATARKVEPEPEPDPEPTTDPGLLDDEPSSDLESELDAESESESESEVEVEPRTYEAQVGVFTLDDGSLDASGRRLCTLEAYLDGDVPHVSVAVDLEALPAGARLRIPALEAACGQTVPLRAVHETERTRGVGAAYLEVCVSEPDGPLARALLGLLQVHVG
jgi:hypothetical protein